MEDTKNQQPIKQDLVQESGSLLKKFPKVKRKSTLVLIAGSLVVVLLGVGTGWFLSGSAKGKSDAQVFPRPQKFSS